MSIVFKEANTSNIVIHSDSDHTIADDGSTLKSLSFTRNTNERLLYINYPESIMPFTNCYANNTTGNNKMLFQTTINANETVQLFFSHHNRSGSAINYSILIWNPASAGQIATVTATNYGYDKGYGKAEFLPWSSFYAGNGKSVAVDGQKSGYLFDKLGIEPDEQPFSGIMRLTTNRAVVLTVYIWKGSDRSVMDGTETQYPYDKNEAPYPEDKSPAEKYTGIGSGYYLISNNTITAAEASGNGVYYGLADVNLTNTNEMIPIALSGANYTAQKGQGKPLGNLGNWGAQYQIITTLDNSASSVQKTFKAYIGRCMKESKYFIRYGAEENYCSMGDPNSDFPTAYKWNFFDVTVPARSKETFSFLLSHPTCSCAPIYIQWKI